MQKEANNDQELIFKKRARRRLVGAVALVLLMIIVLPMILKERTFVQPKEEITITLPNESLSANTTPNSKNDSIITQEKSKDDFDSNIDDANQVANQIPLETLKNDSQAKNNLDVDDDDLQALTDKSAALKTDKTTKKTIDKKNPDLENKVELKPDATSHFYVQVGVFSDVENVKQLQAKLNDIGYKSQTEKINTDKGVKIRLRTQSFDSRSNAATALENIKEAGLTGMVVSKTGA